MQVSLAASHSEFPLMLSPLNILLFNDLMIWQESGEDLDNSVVDFTHT